MRRPGFLGSTNYWFTNKRRNSFGKWTSEQRFRPSPGVPKPDEEDTPKPTAPSLIKPKPKPAVRPRPQKPKAAPKPKGAPKLKGPSPATVKACMQGAQNLISRGMTTMARFPGGIKAYCEKR